MRIQLDTIDKIIKIEDKVNLKELFAFLDKILPNKEWEEFSLEISVINNWTTPTIVPWYPYQPFYPNYPWYGANGNVGVMPLSSGIYNISSNADPATTVDSGDNTRVKSNGILV